MKTLCAQLLGLNTMLFLLLLGTCSVQSSGRVNSCCLRTSGTKLRPRSINSYYQQERGICPVDAVVFVTVKGIRICSLPSEPWVEKAMQSVDDRKKKHRLTAATRLSRSETGRPVTPRDTANVCV